MATGPMFFVERFTGDHWKLVEGEYYTGEGKRIEAFALLADVPNQTGIQPMRSAKKLPKLGSRTEVSAEVQKAYNDGKNTRDYPNNRITSWFTLADLFSHNWKQFSRTWGETDFSIDTIGRLRELAEGEDPNHLRIVFWFDYAETELDLFDNRADRYPSFP